MSSERPELRLIAGIPLFSGLSEEALHELAHVLQAVQLQSGEVLCRQGEVSNGLYVIAAGTLGVYSRLPAGREVELARLGAGDVVGELALVDGGMRTATVRALEPTSAFLLSRADFLLLIGRTDQTALAIRRHVARIVCERLRRRCASLAGSPRDGSTATRGQPPEPIEEASTRFAPARAPAPGYLVRLPFFQGFAETQLEGLLDVCHTVFVPARRTLLRAGARADVAYVTLNGAVEETLERGRRRIRVRLAGPGSTVGAVGLVDGGPSPMSAATRERSLLLAVPRATFGELFDGGTALSYAFVGAVERELVAALLQAERPQARLAAMLPRPETAPSAGDAWRQVVGHIRLGDVQEGAGELDEAIDVREVRRKTQ